MKNIIASIAYLSVLQGCASAWHCTNGGQWSSYYASGDGRCSYFCADPEEKYCAATPLLAEEKQRVAHQIALENNPEYQAFVERQKKQQRATDKATCIDLGFKEGTDAMAMCMLTQSQNRREDSISQQRAFEKANQQQLQKQAADRARAVRSVERAVDSINANMPVTCTTIGTITTCR